MDLSARVGNSAPLIDLQFPGPKSSYCLERWGPHAGPKGTCTCSLESVTFTIVISRAHCLLSSTIWN
jgi:hypothetical protein